jgi:hypothetical protein
MKEVLGAKLEFGSLWGFICKIAGALVNWRCNLELKEGLNCKIGGRGSFWNYFSKTRGIDGIFCEGLDYGLISGKGKGLCEKVAEIGLTTELFF